METVDDLEYTEIPARAREAIKRSAPDPQALARYQERFRDVVPRGADVDGGVETLDGAAFTHRFVDVPGDQERVRFHYVEAGDPAGETILFLHGLPESWYQWHHQMAALAPTHRCVAFDLKGYGQSEKTPGDYRHQGAAEQLVAALDAIGLDTFDLVTHDRGTVQGDFIAADHADRVLRYGRGEQHLHHFNPALATQGPRFAEAPRTGLMDDPVEFVTSTYALIATHELPDAEMRRVIEEFSYEGVNRAVPRYFNSSTFRQEWIERRLRLMPAWRCPVMILQGHDDHRQPREFYEHARDHVPRAAAVEVRYAPGGHFWPMERPEEATALLRELLAMPT